MEERGQRVAALAALVLLFAGLVLQYLCPGGGQCRRRRGGGGGGAEAEEAPPARGDPYGPEDASPARFVPRRRFRASELLRRADFRLEGDDLMVFLHIQKTGGTTFGRHLVRNLRLPRPCRCRAGQKKCACLRPGRPEPWLFSRFSTGWSCGLHADWTELNTCLPGLLPGSANAETEGGGGGGGSTTAHRNFYYITILRDPVSRYLSEWRHVQRGATWKASLHVCDGRSPTSEELPSCYSGDDWSGCSLQEFMDCPYNLANNRQVRMLADLSLVGCYNLSVMPEEERNQVLLDSAKENLKRMAFFGLTEFQRKTQYLFEKTFNMSFIAPFTQFNSTRASSVDIDEATQARIEALNFLDVALYDYAKDLFLQRYQFTRQKEHQEARRKRQEQRKMGRARPGHGKEAEAANSTDYANNVELWR
ncbi:heparan-sulfate 6-O-sulfotransferase 2 [Anolis carolinensis]|uniref:heparan-sulfate 6-O-sulfotransferase 2 n=1 Tax=Anolis carolinensis TaxID=28377 RepID=UPI002F2B71B1